MVVQCVECGVELKPAARFCSACGTSVGGATAPSPVERQSLVLQREVPSGRDRMAAPSPVVAATEWVPPTGLVAPQSAPVIDLATPSTGVHPASSPAAPAPNYSTSSSIEAAPLVGSNAIVNVHMQAPGMVAAPKSAGVALLLTFFFGPLGMLYSTMGGALVMFGLTLLLFWSVLAIPFLWLGAMVWGVAAVSSSNAAVAAGRVPNIWGR